MNKGEKVAHLDIAVPLEVEHRERADIPKPIDVHRELPEKVDDRGCTRRERVPQHERRQYHRRQLLRKRQHLDREELAKLPVHARRVQGPAPLVRHVVRVLDDVRHEQLRVEHAVLLGDHAARGGEHGAEDGDVEEDGPVRGDFEVEEDIWVDDGREHEHGCEGARDECHESSEAVVSVRSVARLGSGGERRTSQGG